MIQLEIISESSEVLLCVYYSSSFLCGWRLFFLLEIYTYKIYMCTYTFTCVCLQRIQQPHRPTPKHSSFFRKRRQPPKKSKRSPNVDSIERSATTRPTATRATPTRSLYSCRRRRRFIFKTNERRRRKRRRFLEASKGFNENVDLFLNFFFQQSFIILIFNFHSEFLSSLDELINNI